MSNQFEFSEQQIERYARHIILKGVGGTGQRKLLEARVLVVGMGGLGCPVAMYLTAAGIGQLGLVDADCVDLSNLQRQVLYGMNDLGQSKLSAAAARLRQMNPEVHLDLIQKRVEASNVLEIIQGYDVVIDGTDNFPAHYLLNDACVLSMIPFIHAGILQFEGQVLTVIPGKSPCYRCLFPDPPPEGVVPTCEEAGILGVVPGVLGVLEATEAIKLILTMGEPLTGRVLRYDALRCEFRKISFPRDPDCCVCGDHPTISAPVDMVLPSCQMDEMGG